MRIPQLLAAAAPAGWALCLLAGPAAALPPPRPVACSLAIVHVDVLPMTTEAVLRDQTVRVGAGRILSVGPGSRDSARGCTERIDGVGRYLSPGLNDLHVHLDSRAFSQAFGAPGEPIDYRAGLAPYLANGVTGIRVMSGAPDILAFRNAQRGQASPYPRMVVASPMLSGEPPVLPEPVTKVVRTPAEARAAVAEFARAGYDFIKVRDNLKPAVLREAIAEAGRDGLYVDGHLSQGQGLSVAEVLAAGQKGVAHIDNFALDLRDPATDPARYAALLRACDCFVSTTLQVERNAVRQITDYDALAARPGVMRLRPIVRDRFWLKPNNPYLAGKADPKFFAGLYETDKRLVKAFSAAGVHLVAGTDALNPMILPGESLHDELDSLVEAGLSPYQALRTATANPAAYVPGFADVGVIAPGAAANAVLTEGDPLVDLHTLRRPVAVMINGHWMTAETLDRLMAETARTKAP